MATFEAKTWEDRVSEYPTRRILTNISTGTAETVTVERSEGTITNPGDLFNASNMNDLEGRIGDAIDSLNSTFQDGVNAIVAALADEGIVLSASTPEAIEAAINNLRSGGDATAGQILKDKTGYVNKNLVTGTMPNRGAWTGNAPSNGGNITIPDGYHSGNGYVSCAQAYQGGRTQGQSDKTAKVTKAFDFGAQYDGASAGRFWLAYYPNGQGVYPGAAYTFPSDSHRIPYGTTYRLKFTFNTSHNAKATDFSYTLQQLA